MTVWGHHEVLRRLAVGGTAEVWLARDAHHEFVVLKRLHAHLSRDTEFAESFVNEARVSARLQHPNIARLLEFGVADERPFLVYEWVDGVDLRTLVDHSGPLSFQGAAQIANSVAQVLCFAHGFRDERGPQTVVHGDLSMRNVMISRQGVVKVIDFGLGTLPGQATLSATAPEQLEGAPASPSSDQFALGALAYELLSGRSAFDAESDIEMMHRLSNEQVSIPAHWPKALASIVGRMLAHEPGDRFADCAGVELALREFLAEFRSPVDLGALVAHALAPIAETGRVVTENGTVHRFAERLALVRRGATLSVADRERAAAWLAPVAGVAELLAGAVARLEPEQYLSKPFTSETHALAWVLSTLSVAERDLLRQIAQRPPTTIEVLETTLDFGRFEGQFELDVLQSLTERALLQRRNEKGDALELEVAPALVDALRE